MEATNESVGLLDTILPPDLADAGLEDCALPPESIHEAFRKAAVAVKSRAASLFECEEDTGPCLAGEGIKKLAESEQIGDALVVVAGEGGERRSSGDGLKDLDVEGLESNKEKKDQSEEDQEEEMKPILV